ncbi:MAG: multicopper oxidase domain-containing protein [Gemmatimonadaceae bacterium]|nr:multicopper oxidase domain-containing protein [Gemmatimonadaceae bacterium]
MPTRRDLLWALAGATGAVVIGAAGRRVLDAAAHVRASRDGRVAGSPDYGAGNTHAPYGHGAEPPTRLGPHALDAATIPPPPVRGAVARTLTITQRPVEVAQGVTMDAWTFDGAVPGPVLRITEGETLTLTVRNLTAHPHNLHAHGAHAPGQDGWEPIPAGGTRTYVLVPRPYGLYPYHCDLVPGAAHLGRGLHGLLIVDPPAGRAPATERTLVLGGFDADGDGRSERFGWNGVAGFFARHPLKVRRGERVRLYVANLVVDEPVATFHLHANTFGVIRSGTGMTPGEITDVAAMTVGERAILEMRFDEPGRYMFHPHQGRMAEAGAMGWIAVE